jgi:hypothetical protein
VLTQDWHGTAKSVHIKAEGVFDDQNGQASSYRRIVDRVNVSIDGKKTDTLFLNPYGFTSGIDMLEVWMWSDGGPTTVRKCTYLHHADEPALRPGCQEAY